MILTRGIKSQSKYSDEWVNLDFFLWFCDGQTMYGTCQYNTDSFRIQISTTNIIVSYETMMKMFFGHLYKTV